MNLIKLTFLTTILFLSQLTDAHPEHDHQPPPVSKEQAIEIATNKLQQLITKGIVADSWKGIKTDAAELMRVDGRQTWMVEFKQADAKILYVKLTRTGYFLAHSEKKE